MAYCTAASSPATIFKREHESPFEGNANEGGLVLILIVNTTDRLSVP